MPQRTEELSLGTQIRAGVLHAVLVRDSAGQGGKRAVVGRMWRVGDLPGWELLFTVVGTLLRTARGRIADNAPMPSLAFGTWLIAVDGMQGSRGLIGW